MRQLEMLQRGNFLNLTQPFVQEISGLDLVVPTNVGLPHFMDKHFTTHSEWHNVAQRVVKLGKDTADISKSGN